MDDQACGLQPRAVSSYNAPHTRGGSPRERLLLQGILSPHVNTSPIFEGPDAVSNQAAQAWCCGLCRVACFIAAYSDSCGLKLLPYSSVIPRADGTRPVYVVALFSVIFKNLCSLKGSRRLSI